MKKNIIISSSDSKYFPLLKELFLSLKFNKILETYDFGILDTGLENEDLNFLKDSGAIIKKAKWEIDVPEYKIRKREHLKTQFARAFLPDYFLNYDIYIWLDADVWINHKETFLLYEKGAKKDKLVITPQIDRAYGPLAKIDWFFGFPKKIRTINYKNISKSVSYKTARKLSMHPTLNAGAFSMNNNLNNWKIFQKNIKKAARRGRIFGTDQVALALSVYEDDLATEFLPSYTNWMCEFHLPLYDENNKVFLEPYLPNHPIGLMHLAGLDKIRSNVNIKSNIKTLDGKNKSMSIRFNRDFPDNH